MTRNERGREQRVIAALFVESAGVYSGREDVDIWDAARDARQYGGPHPIVAHPPCERWSSLNNLVLARYPEKAAQFAHGNDGGCFRSALEAVRQWGGVLEHPAHSRAWPRFGLPRPTRGRWQRGTCGGWATEMDQAALGHPARKRTWLYVYGTDCLPPVPATEVDSPTRVRAYRRRAPDGTWYRTHDSARQREITHRAAKATPPPMAEWLLAIARACHAATAQP